MTDIEYESPGGLSNLLDVYVPEGGVNSGFPTLLYIHGGAWYTGDKAWHAPLHKALAKQGYTVVSCNYTLSTQISPSFPQAVHDVKAVVRWIRTTGVEEYNLSPVIVPFGTSAGGHLTMMLQTTAGMDYFEPLLPPPGGYAVQAAVPFFGPADLVLASRNGFADDWRIVRFLGAPYREDTAELWALASPMTHLDPNDPPVAIYHGVHDRTVPFRQARAMDKAATAAGLMSWFFSYDGGHSFKPGLGGHEGAALRLQQIVPAMLVGDRAGNAPFTGGDIRRGRKVSGDLASIFHSDDEYLKVRSDSGLNGQAPPVSLVADAQIGLSDARTISLAVESRMNVPAGTLTVYLNDYEENCFIEVGQFAVGLEETTHVVKNIEIANYQDKFDDLKIAVDFALETPDSGAEFEVWVNRVHVHAR